MSTQQPANPAQTKRTRQTSTPSRLTVPIAHVPERIVALPQALLELAPDAIVVADPMGQILLVNHQTEVLFGYTRADMLGQPVELLLPEHLRSHHEQHRASYVAAPHTRPMGTGLDLFGRRQDGSTFPVEVSLSPVQVSDDLLIIGIIRDISERKRFEIAERLVQRATERRQQLLQGILDELPGGAYLVQGPEAALVLANHAAMAVWGGTWPEGQPMAEFLQTSGVQYFAETGQPLPLHELVTWQIVHGSPPALQRREVVRRADGTRLAILLNAVAIDVGLLEDDDARGENTTTASVYANPSDVNPLRERAALVLIQDIAALQAAEQLKDEFISIAAHELRTPLTAIQGFASMLSVQTALGHGPELADWQTEAIAEIEEASARLNGLINDLLDATRIQAGRLELHRIPLELVALLRRSLARIQTATTRHTVTLVVETMDLEAPDESVLLEADGMRLEQVFGNLLGNAVKYSPEGGPITVTVRADQAAGLAEVCIHDAGIGIPGDQQALLFQRFARASNVHDHHIAGSGLGLYVCRELVERHGGHIWFESTEGAGTTFHLTLPTLPIHPVTSAPSPGVSRGKGA